MQETIARSTRLVIYFAFLFLLSVKMFYFAKFTDSTFILNNIQFFINGFKQWIATGSPDYFYKGLFLVSFGSFLLLTFWTFLLSKRGQFIALSIIYILVSFITVADLVYYRYFHDLIAIDVMAQVGQIGAIGGSIANLFELKDLIIVGDAIIILILLIVVLVKTRKDENYFSWSKITATVLAFALGFLFVRAPINDYIEKYSVAMFNQNWHNMSIYNQTGLIGFHAFDIYRYVDTNFINKREISAVQKQEVRDWFEEHHKDVSEKTEFFGVAEGKNLIVLQLEAYQSFFINKKINGKEITPNINELMKESLFFDNFYMQTALGRTSDAEFLANESLHPMAAGSVYVKYANNEFDALPGILKEHGYETAAFHAYEKSFWNRYAMYNNIGFDHFIGKGDFEPGEKAGWALGDQPLFQQGVDRMLEYDKPFYTFFVALSSHHPYHIQSKYRELNVGKYKGTLMGDYLQAVHYVDKAVGAMVDRLKKEGLWDESVFMIYGDHDAGIDSKLLAEVAGVEPTVFHQKQLFNQLPLLIHLPGDKGAGLYKNTGGQLDIATTALHALGIDPSQFYMMGDNLFEFENELVVFRNGSFVNGEVYYAISGDGIFENGTCFDFQTGEKIDVTQCREGYENGIEELEASDAMIYGNLIEEFREE